MGDPTSIGPLVKPSIFTPHNVVIQDEIADIIAGKLAAMPDNALSVSVRYTDGNTLVTTVATRTTLDNGWVLGAGIYARKTHDRPVEVGVEGILKWK